MGCFTSISDIFHTLLCSSGTPHTSLTSIPDDILLDIFSRLPADCVRQCRKVCRNWRALTSLRSFAEMHYRRASCATSAIYVVCDHSMHFDSIARPHFLVLDGKKRRLKLVNWESSWVINSINSKQYLNCSFGGLLLYREREQDDYCIICDTRYIDGSRSIIKLPKPKGKVCGVYFLPLASEYKILYHCQNHYYFLYDSKTMIWKMINSTPYPFRPRDCSPDIINMAMHWMIDVKPVKSLRDRFKPPPYRIMGFKMDTEECFALPHPEINCDHVVHHQMMDLFVKDELLCLFDPRFYYENGGGIDIWILEDYESGFWVKRHRLSVGMFRNPLYGAALFFVLTSYKVSLGVFNEDELLMNWFSMGFYLVNLTQGTVEKLKDPCLTYSGFRRYILAPHTNSLHPSPN